MIGQGNPGKKQPFRKKKFHAEKKPNEKTHKKLPKVDKFLLCLKVSKIVLNVLVEK